MDTFSWSQIIFAGLAAVGGVAGLVKLLQFLVGLWDRRRQARIEAATRKINESVEIKRLAAEAEHIDDEAIKLALWKIIEERKTEIDELRDRVIELEQSHSLSRPRILKIYGAVRAIRNQVNILDTLIIGMKDSPNDLSQEVEILRQRLDDLEQALP